MENIERPVRGNYQVTYTYNDHLQYASEHPEITYNGGIDYYSDDRNIRSCDDGTVEKVGFDAKGYGNYIKIKHSWGYSLYAHLSTEVNFPIGFEITRGMIIGIMGTTGFSTGTHLHFEVRDTNNKFFDPTSYILDYGNENTINIQNPIEEVADTSDTIVVPTEENKLTHNIRVCADTAGVRYTPAGDLLYYATKGEVFLKGDETKEANGYIWQKVYKPFWIAQHDGNEPLIEDV